MAIGLYFGILKFNLGPHSAEILSSERLIEDSAYVSTNKLVERMLVTGQVPRVPDELFDEEENFNDPQIPSDAPLRELDADITDAAHVSEQLQYRIESNGAGEVSSDANRVEGSENGSGSVNDPDSDDQFPTE